MAGEWMVWSSRCWRVSHLREAILLSFPVGRSLKEETSSRRERETDKRIGSEGKCGRWLRATNHMVMERGGRNYSSEHVESHTAITGLTVCFPHGCCSAAISPWGTSSTPGSVSFTSREQREGGGGIRVSLRSNSQGMSFLDSVIKARSVPLWCNLTRHKAQIMINELFTKAEPTPVALSHTNFPQMSQLSSDWRAYVGNTASLSTKGIWISAVAIMTLLITTFCTLKGRSGYPRTRLLTELAFDLTRRSSYGRNIVGDQTDSGVKSRMRSMIDVKYWGILKRKIYFSNYRLVFGF